MDNILMVQLCQIAFSVAVLGVIAAVASWLIFDPEA